MPDTSHPPEPKAGTQWRDPRLGVGGITLALLALAALALRAPQFGNPLFDIDEQFYLLVGDRMLHGAIPYIDVWDRKPAGLFLIYAAIRLLGGDGVIQYQLVATFCAVITAATIAAIARRMTNPAGAAAGGFAYLVWLNLLGGGGGQSPVFYNVPTALAALATLRALDGPAPVATRRHCYAAMLAMGLALQIKPTVVFEGCLFGLAFLSLAWAREGRAAALALALRLIAIALAPTLAVLAFYLAIGEARAFWFANAGSILLRTTPPNANPGARLGAIAMVLLPLALAAFTGLAGRWRGSRQVRFVALWLAVSVAGFLAVAPYYNHYALPLLVPLAIAAALAFGRGVGGLAAAAVLSAAMLALAHYPDLDGTGAARARLARLSGIVSAHLHGGCLFVFQGPPILYQTTGACATSRYLFPAHLNYLGEARAIGVDPAAEVARIIAARPAVIVTSRRAAIVDPNPRTWDIVEAALARDYRLVGTGRADRRMLGVYARRDR